MLDLAMLEAFGNFNLFIYDSKKDHFSCCCEHGEQEAVISAKYGEQEAVISAKYGEQEAVISAKYIW